MTGNVNPFENWPAERMHYLDHIVTSTRYWLGLKINQDGGKVHQEMEDIRFWAMSTLIADEHAFERSRYLGRVPGWYRQMLAKKETEAELLRQRTSPVGEGANPKESAVAS